MKKQNFFLGMALVSAMILNAQEQNEIQEELGEVIVSSTRIDLPFSQNSRTIQVITAEEIEKSGATTVVDLLQQVAGVDIRQRGLKGSQADLYIRGGSFDQTLLLIDGIKIEDAQTGHHTLNLALPLEVIERIEIIKGPAARVFGQNAFTGAINIVTKSNPDKMLKAGVEGGSYQQINGSITAGITPEGSSHILNYTRNTSEGYRYNTDFDNQQYFLKSTFNKNHTPINMIATLAERKFGANGFYATPAAKDQYEETQASLIGLTTTIQNKNLILKPKVYWRRNQDMYLYLRNDPTFYHNLHITNKIGGELDASYASNLGITGFGVEVAQVYIRSNNLGDNKRFMTNLFLEHQFKLFNEKMDITPGVAVNYFSDFKFHAFPGMDLGYTLTDHLRAYANVGYTYRVPTYTDLYYQSGTTIGNPNLDTEEALAEEVGFKYIRPGFQFTAAYFNRDSKKLIDYVKTNQDDKWEPQNIRDVNSTGFELESTYQFKMGQYPQYIKSGYMFLKDDIKNITANFSQYAINSMKHHVTATWQSQFIKNVSESVTYKYVERTSGNSYTVLDAGATYQLHHMEFSVIANNILNETYTETSLVPMPKGNLLFGFTYLFQ